METDNIENHRNRTLIYLYEAEIDSIISELQKDILTSLKRLWLTHRLIELNSKLDILYGNNI